jgi:hypothetical protein
MVNNIEQVIEYMNNKNYHNKGKIIYTNNISLLELQISLCKLLKECYIFTGYIQDDNTAFQLYKNNIFGLIKQNNNMLYIWKIK